MCLNNIRNNNIVIIYSDRQRNYSDLHRINIDNFRNLGNRDTK